MPVRTIRKWPYPGLRRQSKPVSDFSEARVLAQDLRDTMVANFGIGLAAPQVGEAFSVVVVNREHVPSLPESTDIPGVCVIINPEIQYLGEDKFKWEEACLSVGDYQGVVARHAKISITFTNLKNEITTCVLENDEAGIVQHETDHLFGRLFIDLLPNFERRTVMRRLRRKFKEAKRMKTRKSKEHLQQLSRVRLRKSRKKRPPKTFGKRKK